MLFSIILDSQGLIAQMGFSREQVRDMLIRVSEACGKPNPVFYSGSSGRIGSGRMLHENYRSRAVSS